MTPNWFTAMSNTGPEYTVIAASPLSHHYGRSPATAPAQAIPGAFADIFCRGFATGNANVAAPATYLRGIVDASPLYRTDLYRRHLHHRPHAHRRRKARGLGLRGILRRQCGDRGILLRQARHRAGPDRDGGQ